MGSLMGSIGFVSRVVLCFLSSLGSFPLTSFLFHANRLSRSQIGLAETLRASILASTFDKVSMDNFCHPNLSGGGAKVSLFCMLRYFPSHGHLFAKTLMPPAFTPFRFVPGFWHGFARNIYHIVHLPLSPVKPILVSDLPLQTRNTRVNRPL